MTEADRYECFDVRESIAIPFVRHATGPELLSTLSTHACSVQLVRAQRESQTLTIPKNLPYTAD